MKKKITKRTKTLIFKIANVILGILGGYAICVSSIGEGRYIIANLAVIPLAVALMYFWFKVADFKSRRWVVFHAIFALLVSGILIIGGQLNIQNDVAWSWRTLAKILLGGFAIFPLLEIARKLLRGFTRGQEFEPSKKHKIVAFVAPLIACLVMWVVFFPGIYTYDMASWNEMMSQGIISPHWSITYGYYLAFFLDAGHMMFGNYEAGFAVAMLVQLVFLSYVIYRIVMFVAYKTKNKIFYIGSLLFFLLSPFILAMSVADAQDVAFGGVLALLVLEIYECIDKRDYGRRKLNIAKLLLLAFLLTTLRNNGVICLLVGVVLILLVKIPNKKIIAGTLFGAVVMSFLYTGPIYNLMGVQENNSSIQEILGVPSQQLAKVYFENRGSFSDEELVELGNFYNLEGTFNDYEDFPMISDSTKSTLNSEYAKAHLGEYLGLWMKIGVENPARYVEAFLLNSFGFWYPMKNYDDPRLNLEFMNYPGFAMTVAFDDSGRDSMKEVRRLTPDNKVTGAMDWVLYRNGWYRIPVVAQISSIGVYTLTVVYAIGVIIMKKSRKWAATLGPVFGLTLTLFLAPVAIFRYAFPIAILMPVFIGAVWQMANGEKTERSISKKNNKVLD